jgi:hypothetical protein
MSLLSDSDRQRLKKDALRPIPKIDDQSELTFYVISSDFFEKIAPLIPASAVETWEFASQNAKTALAAGWADPIMSAYDHYDESLAAS